MPAAYFDSRKYYNRLVEAGTPPTAADVMTEAMYELACEVAKCSARVGHQGFPDELEDSQQVINGGIIVEHRGGSCPLSAGAIDSKIDVMASHLRCEIARSATETTKWVGIGFIAIIVLLEVMLIASIP